MLTEILISFGVAIGLIIVTIAITLVGASLLLLIEKIIDKIKNNLGDKKFYNIKKFSTLGLVWVVYILIVTYVVYNILFM